MIGMRNLLVVSVVALSATGIAGCDRALAPDTPQAPSSGKVPVDDIQIYYEIHGDGTPLMLLHGGLGHAGYWDKQIPALSERYKVIAIDSRGHGRSTYSEEPINYSLMASDVVGVMDALGIAKAHVLGWSDGANTGLDMAIHHRNRLIKVIAFGGNTAPSGVRADFAEHPTVTRYMESASADYQRLSPEPEQWDAFLANMQNMWASEPRFTPEQLGSITVPVLILTGVDEEVIHTDHTKEMAEIIPTATLTLISGTGHFANWERPEEFNEIALRFLDE
jgi:pimeloyl-ACP methyl ester carboxylesterase